MKYQIKITGSGTVEEIKNALQETLRSITEADIDNGLNGLVLEDETLFTEINAK